MERMRQILSDVGKGFTMVHQPPLNLLRFCDVFAFLGLTVGSLLVARNRRVSSVLVRSHCCVALVGMVEWPGLPQCLPHLPLGCALFGLSLRSNMMSLKPRGCQSSKGCDEKVCRCFYVSKTASRLAGGNTTLYTSNRAAGNLQSLRES